MSLTWVIGGVDLSTKVEFGTITDLTTAARGGTRGGGTVIVTDPTGTLDLRGWRPCYAEEPASTAQPRVFTGFIGGKKIKRGPEGPIGPGRVWECQLQDLNAVFHMLVWRGTTAIRDPETNLARVAALLASRALSGLLADTGYVGGTAQPFEKADYRDQYADQVLDDITGAVARDYFAFWDPLALAASLFFNFRDAAINDSTIKINNFAAAADYATVFPTGTSGGSDDAELDQAGDEVYSGDVYKYVGAEVYVERPTTAAAYIARDNVYETTRIRSQASALLQAGYFLDGHATEKDVLTIPIRLPASKVGLVDAGQRIQVKLEHLPGYDSGYVWVRIAERRLSQVEVDDAAGGHYDLVLTCTNAAPASGGGTGGTGGFPYQPPGAGTLVQHAINDAGTVTLAAAPTDGNYIVVAIARGSATPGTPSGFSVLVPATHFTDPSNGNSGYLGVFGKVASGDSGTYTNGQTHEITFAAEYSGVVFDAGVSLGTNLSTAITAGGPLTPGAANAIVLGFSVASSFWTVSVTPAVGTTELDERSSPGGDVWPDLWAATKSVATPAATTIAGTLVSTVPGSSEVWAGSTISLIPSAATNPPKQGQWVYGEVLTITGTTGTSAFPYAAGSLVVRVDGVLIARTSYTETNPGTGAITLGWTKDADEVVTIDYQGI